MCKVAMEIINMMKEWQAQINEKNAYIKELEERLQIGGDSNLALSKLCDDQKKDLETAQKIIAQFMKIDCEGDPYIIINGGVYPEVYDLLRALDIPMTESEVKENED